MMYYDYLSSHDWKLKKEAKIKKTKKRCAICGSCEKIQLHHLFYRKVLESAELSDLRWLCDLCHTTTHQLIKSGILTFPKPGNHHSCFTITKTQVKKALGLSNRNICGGCNCKRASP